jgi:hypothetical protein
LDPKRLDVGNKPKFRFRGVKKRWFAQAMNHCLATDRNVDSQAVSAMMVAAPVNLKGASRKGSLGSLAF